MNKRQHFRLDTDRDGVFDYKDCRPFNPRLQHAKPNRMIREELESLPIYVHRGGEKYHVMSKDARKKAPLETQKTLSLFKKYPTTVKSIREGRPQGIVFGETIYNDDDNCHGVTDMETKGVAVRFHRPYINVTREEATRYVDNITSRLPPRDSRIRKLKLHRDTFADEDRDATRKKRIRATAWTTFHECEHLEQAKDPHFIYRYLEDTERVRGTISKPEYELEADENAIELLKIREQKQRKDFLREGFINTMEMY